VPQNCEVAARSPALAAGRTDARSGPACVGFIDRSERESHTRIECVLSFCQCPSVADENREAMRTTSMMDDCNARAPTPRRKSSIAVLASRLVLNIKSRQPLEKRPLTGFELLLGRFTLSRLDAAPALQPTYLSPIGIISSVP